MNLLLTLLLSQFIGHPPVGGDHGNWHIQGEYSGTGCRTCAAGTGYYPPQRSYTVLIVRPARVPRLVFGWDTSVLPHLPAGYERVRAP